MVRALQGTTGFAAAVGILACALHLGCPSRTRAADHGDGALISVDRAGDLGDLFVFLDPNDSTKVIMAMTVQGFIVPGEAVNFSVFDRSVRFRFELETTGDAKPDKFIDVMFSEKTKATTEQQTATITLPSGAKFTAPTTLSNLSAAASPPVITTDPASGVSFFAGEVDDPFFFDIPGFNRFVASVLRNAADPTQLQRGRDTFAGYNTLAIALSVPVSLLQPVAGNTLGVDARTQRLKTAILKKSGQAVVPRKKRLGPRLFLNLDRMGNPAVNVALVPFARKNEYNLASTEDDAKGKFATDIMTMLTKLGTSQANINVLAQVAVQKGDLLRLDLGKANSGPGGGNNAAAAYPNGRRLGDDTIDTILTIVTNGAITTGDNVNANDVPLRDAFPFFAAPQQPRAPGIIDDNTRN